MLAASYITKYPSLFISNDLTQVELFITNEIGVINKPLKKTIIDYIVNKHYLNEKFFKLIRLLKYWSIDADSCNSILKLKKHNCFRDEYSSIITGHLWLDSILLNERPGLGIMIIRYSHEVGRHKEFNQLVQLFEKFSFIKEQELENFFDYDTKVVFNVTEDSVLSKLKKEYTNRYKTAIVFHESEESTIAAHLSLEISNNNLFISLPSKELVSFKSLLQKNPPVKEYLNLSGYGLNSKFIYDMEYHIKSKDLEIAEVWEYYSYFIQSRIVLDDIKILKNLYSEDRLKIMLKEDFFNIDLNQMSIFIKNSYQQNTIDLLPKKPKNLTDLETNLMILQLSDKDFKKYEFPIKIKNLDGQRFRHYTIFVPNSRKDLITVSKLMKNCLFEKIWDERLLQNKEFIIILLNDKKPEIIISFNESGIITDSAVKCNKDVDQTLVKEIQESLIPEL